CTDPVPGWVRGEIPLEIYEAVRGLFPESRPPFRARPFAVQLIGAMVLYQGKISEMKTGEGKTIVGPLACYLACIEHLRVHVVTVNDYLVQRDRDWTFPFFHALGLTVGAIHPMHMQGEDSKRRMSQCDVVYGTTAEFGFDYLRDNMKRSAEAQVQRRRQFAIVDEVDSILIDEARTPLIISGAAHQDKPRYDLADRLARHLVEKQRPWQAAEDRVQACMRTIKGIEGDIRNLRDKARLPELQANLAAAKQQLPALEAAKKGLVQFYDTMPERKQCHLTHDGIAEAQRVAGIGSFYVGENMDVPHLLEQSLRAHVVYQRDRDYIVAPSENPQTGRVEPSVIIVDVNTGRPMQGRQWSDGLHQAVEAKEGVPIKQETQTVATITIQNFFKMYPRLAGMTGTADTEAQEFHDIYRLDVVSIPTNRKMVRRDFDDLVFLSAKDKWEAIVDEIKAFNDAGRPVLVGTTSVEKSEMLSEMLTRRHGIKHEVLNAKQHERESHMIEAAGQLGAVMIATNMAGRGTDIKLGSFTRQALLDHWLRRGVVGREVTIESTDEQLRESAYRKIAPGHLDMPRHKIDQTPFAELEMQLLRHWALKYTWLSPRAIEKMDAEPLRDAIDKNGRFLLHRLRWFSTCEDLGGLHVIGTERHESRRIDNQLRGRSGRQGDRGSSRFFISLEDDLMKMFAGDTTLRILSRLGMKEGDAIEHPILSRSVETAQRKVEERNFQGRKYILDMDEVMEHQRRSFYGLRQRTLDGRDLRGLIFGYIRDAARDAVASFLDADYAAHCASEFARTNLDTSVPARRLRGLEPDEMADRIRVAAKDDAAAVVRLTLGEYMPELGGDSEAAAVDFDAASLINWARDKYGVELSPEELKDPTEQLRDSIEQRLISAAHARIDAADLSGIAQFSGKMYGPESLSRWAKTKFDMDIDPQEVVKAMADGKEAVEELVVERAEGLYRRREIEYPVDFALEMALGIMRQDPAQGLNHLVSWANQRFELGWTVDTIKDMPPPTAREKLLAASEKFITDGVLEREIKAAQALAADADLDAHLQKRFGQTMPEHLRGLKGDERSDAVRARVESILRQELVFFERTMLLEVLDNLWQDHLHGIDQLREGIHLRAVAQQDPRIEFKREASRLFNEMMSTLRDRVTDYVFKLKIMPRVDPAPPRPAPAARPVAGGVGGMSIAGPGLGDGGGLYSPPSAPRADGGGAQAKPAQPPRKLGRNDPCPHDPGKLYKKCCNRPDGTCTGQGVNGKA
ncbi:MAG: preprotein translocase subunit SecA, partial [Phycisphaerae bacterium]|nr:preprotein translocase subunit SecA [Phycisphaerae bacterium]